MASLEKFTATERVDHFTVGKLGDLRSPEMRSFDYVVSVSQKPHGLIELEEYRNGSPRSCAVSGASCHRRFGPPWRLSFHLK